MNRQNEHKYEVFILDKPNGSVRRTLFGIQPRFVTATGPTDAAEKVADSLGIRYSHELTSAAPGEDVNGRTRWLVSLGYAENQGGQHQGKVMQVEELESAESGGSGIALALRVIAWVTLVSSIVVAAYLAQDLPPAFFVSILVSGLISLVLFLAIAQIVESLANIERNVRAIATHADEAPKEMYQRDER